MANILVTCVGSGVGQSAIDSLCFTGRHYIIGCDSNTDVYAFNQCHKFISVPSIYSDGYLEFLLNICIENNVEVIIPGHDHELSLLSKNIEIFHKENIKIIVSPSDIIEISRDKYEWYRIFSSRGVSIVPTFKVKDFIKNPDSSILPAIVKPTGGSASQGIKIINRISEFQDLKEDNIIQPYLFPVKEDVNYQTIKKSVENGRFVQMSEISIQLIFTENSELNSIFISKNILKNGVPVFVDPIQPDDFEYTNDILKFVPILKEYKTKGPVNIQGRITDKGIYFFEMNMRFTGITGNRAQLGFNEVDFLVNNFLGVKTDLNGYTKSKVGARQVACTTIPRQSNLNTKINILILGIESEIANNFTCFINNNENVNIFAVSNSNLSNIINSSDSKTLNILTSEHNALPTKYFQTDVLICFSSYIETHNEFETILFLQEQSRYLIQANIPKIINVSNPNKTKYFNEVMSNILNLTHFLSPSNKFIEFIFNNNFEDLYKIIKG